MALGVKEKGKNLWEFAARQCAHGGAMVQGRYFDFSFSPVITQPALRAFYATSAAFVLTLAIMDVRSCFQNHMIDPDKQVFVRTPPRYME